MRIDRVGRLAMLVAFVASGGAGPVWASGETVSLPGIGVLPRGKTVNIRFRVTVDSPFPAGATEVSNQGTVTGSNFSALDTDDPDVGGTSDPTVTPIDRTTDLSVGKTDGGVTASPGDTVSYTLSFGNSGSQSASNVTLTDVVPANTTFNAGASTAGWTCLPDDTAGSVCTIDVGTVSGNGGGGSVVFAVSVATPVPSGVTEISNTVTIDDDGASAPDTNPANDTATDTTPITAAPDLAITKSDGGASVAPGGTVAYTLGYSNVGDQDATGVVLSETVPAQTTFNAGASTAGWVCAPDGSAGSACTFAVGSLAGGGGSGSATFAVDVANPVPSGVTEVSNTSTLADDGANGADPTPGNNSATDTTPIDASPDLTIVKSDGGITALPGGTIVYTLGYANVGTQAATGVVITDVVPPNTTFNAGASTAGWSCVPDGNAGSTCTLAVGSLAGGGGAGSADFAVTVANPVPAGTTQVSNTATIADDGSNGADPNPADNSSTDVTPIDTNADLAIVKDDGVTTVTQGQTYSYTITVSNAGPADALGAAVDDVLPAVLTGASWTCVASGGATCTAGPVAGDIHDTVDLPAGGSVVYTLTVTLDGSATGSVANTATVTPPATVTDPAPGNNTSTDTDTILLAADLTVTKDDGRATVAPGGTTTYTIVVTNAGPTGVTGVPVTDNLPVEVTVASWTCTPSGTAACGALAGAGNISETVDLPAAGDSVTYSLTATIDLAATGSVTNTVTVGVPAGVGDPDLGNNTASDTDSLQAQEAVKGDFDGDGKADIAAQNKLTGAVMEWLMDGITVSSTRTVMTLPRAADRIVGTGDYDGNGLADILVWNNLTKQAYMQLNGAGAPIALGGPPVVGALIVGNGDYDGDGTSDILWHRYANGQLVMWRMQGGAVAQATPLTSVPYNWRAQFSGDFDGDGRTDILWRNGGNGSTHIWFMDGSNVSSSGETTARIRSTGWMVAGAGDFDGDGKADILWFNGQTLGRQLWLMDGLTVLARGIPAQGQPSAGAIVGVRDFDGDGRADILWKAGTRYWMWLMNGFTRLQRGLAISPASAWLVANPK